MTKVASARKSSGSFEERFLNELARQCDGQDVAILNRVMREQLGWQDERFDKVRAGLLKKGVIKAATGHGGKTRFSNFHEPKPKLKALRVFVSYSHADEGLKDRLLQHLKPLERLGLISSWHDRMIKPGDTFGEVISKELESAEIVLLLVSVDFINSKYCYEVELNRALEQQQSGKTRVIPIILRDCLWTHAPFGGIQALPKDAKAVSSWPDVDEAFTSVAKTVHELAVELVAA
jgi:hypothetical protein